MKQTILVIFLSSFFMLHGKDKKTLSGTWFYQDDYTTNQLVLKKKYVWVHMSCDGCLWEKGRYSIVGDTIILNSKYYPGLRKFLFRDDKVYTYQNEKDEYSEFYSLARTDTTRKYSKKELNGDIEIIELE